MINNASDYQCPPSPIINPNDSTFIDVLGVTMDGTNGMLTPEGSDDCNSPSASEDTPEEGDISNCALAGDEQDDIANDSETSERCDSPNAANKRKKVSRILFTKFQITVLTRRFLMSPYLNAASEREALAKEIGLTPDQVKIWFQNNRYKSRKHHKKELRNHRVHEYLPYPPRVPVSQFSPNSLFIPQQYYANTVLTPLSNLPPNMVFPTGLPVPFVHPYSHGAAALNFFANQNMAAFPRPY